MTRHRHLRALLVAGLASPAIALQLMATARASTTSPIAYGWWSQLSPLPAPPDVPANGMYVQNSPGKPVAIAAVVLPVPPGVASGRLTLDIVGAAVVTQPPVVCRATSAVRDTEDGAWAARPHFDCAHQVAGLLAANQASVSFDVTAFIDGGHVGVVIVAAGTADRVPFAAPSLASLRTVLVPPVTSPRGQPPQGPIPAPTGAAGLPTNTTPGLGLPAPGDLAPQASSPLAPIPILALPTQQQMPIRTPGDAVAAVHSSTGKWAAPAGLGLLILLIVYWTDGFGAVAIRSRHASPRPTQ